jgi:hypothetical protein
MEEFDKRVFLFGTQVGPDGSGFGGVASDKFHLLDVLCRLEAWRGGRNLLLGCRHLRGVHGIVDFFELLAKQDGLCEGSFSVFALLCFLEAAIDDDDTFRSWHL